jgi:NitT/TauT family transport system ATP-binding protein
MNIGIHNISKAFISRNDRIDALKDISFNVSSGEFVCLLGPSGCGKSTLLNIIAGLECPDSGTVQCNGSAVTAPSTDRIVIFQEPALFPWLKVVENVEFGLAVSGTPKKNRREIAQRYLSTVHLTRFQHSAIHELSGGMKQRVALARALALDPAVLLMDEPFGALDAQTRDLLHIELQEIWGSTKKTVIFVTHNVREAIRLGDRVLVMSARPGSIKREFIVDLPRPRQMEDHGLVDMARSILSELRDEVNRAVAGEVDHEAS